MEVFLGLDLGTTGLKAVAVDGSGRIVARAAAASPVDRDAWGPIRQPEAVWAAAGGVVRQVLARLDSGMRVRAMAPASVGEEGLLLDAAGRAVYPAVVWYDHRQPSGVTLPRGAAAEELRQVTGLLPDYGYSLYKWFWLRQHQHPAWREGRLWLSWSDWLAWRLSGEAAMSRTQASRTAAWDVRRGRWLTDRLGESLPRGEETLPPVLPPGTLLGPAGTRGEAWGLAPDTMVAVGGHDHPVGAWGVGVESPERILDSMGTAEMVYRPVPDIGPMRLATGIEYGDSGFPVPRYLGGGVHTGLGMAALGRILGLPAGEWDRAAARAGPGAGGLRVRWPRLGEPPRFGLEGVGPESTPEEVLRAGYEASAMAIVTLTRAMADLLPGWPEPEVVVIGGGLGPELLRIKATLWGRALNVAGGEDAVALGAARLAARAVNVDLPLPPYRARVEPVHEWETVYREWADAGRG